MSNWLEDKMTSWHNSISGLTQIANSTTGESDSNIGDAVASLIAGYGGGGGGTEWKSGTVTPTSTAYATRVSIPHNLGRNAKCIVLMVSEAGISTSTTYNVSLMVLIPDVMGSSKIVGRSRNSTKYSNFVVSSTNPMTDNGNTATVASQSGTYWATVPYTWYAI